MSDNNNLVLVSNNVQPAVIDYNYEAVKKCVELKAQQYAGIIVTDDNLKQAKQDRDNLTSARVAIDKFRKAKKKEMSVNIDLMEKQCKELISIIEGVEKPLQAGIDVYDNEKREKRRQQALKFIQTTVDSLGLRSEYASRLVVKDFYLNLTGTQKEVKEDINKEGLALKAEQDKHDADIQTIRTVVDSVNNSLSTKLDVEEFINVLKFYSVSEVVDNINKRAEQLKEAEKRVREEAERKAKEEEARRQKEAQNAFMKVATVAQAMQEMTFAIPQQAASGVSVAQTMPGQIPQVQIPVPTFANQEKEEEKKEEMWLLSVSIRGTSDQLKMLNKFLLDNNIEYRRMNCVRE